MDDKSKAWRTSAESREGKAKNIIEDVSSLPLRFFFLSCIASINEYRRLRHKFPFTLCHALTCNLGLQVYGAFCHFCFAQKEQAIPPLTEIDCPMRRDGVCIVGIHLTIGVGDLTCRLARA